MISIIICSANKSLLKQVMMNIEETIGVHYEIIAIENTVNRDGICAVYNRGGNKASFPFLCFIHEDIFFETINWGLLIEQHFSDPEIGLIGLAGGDTKGIVPSSWSSSYKSNEINIYQHYKDGSEPQKQVIVTQDNLVNPIKKVVALDGVFLCTRKKVFDKFKFDEQNFKGFHGYDIDYSLQVLKEYRLAVIFDITVHHYSQGTPDKKWVDSAITISKKWKASLPVSVYPLTPEDFNLHHWKTLQIFLDRLFGLNYSFSKIIYYYLYYSFNRFFNIRRFLSMGKYVLIAGYKKISRQNNCKINNQHFGKVAIETGQHNNK